MTTTVGTNCQQLRNQRAHREKSRKPKWNFQNINIDYEKINKKCSCHFSLNFHFGKNVYMTFLLVSYRNH